MLEVSGIGEVTVSVAGADTLILSCARQSQIYLLLLPVLDGSRTT